jgi:hypothetical protein
MTSIITPFPSAELMLIAQMGQVFSNEPTWRFCSSLPATIAGPTIRFKRISGAARNIRIDHPVTDVDVFSSDYGISDSVARQIEVALLMTRGTQVLNLGVIQTVTVVNGPHWLPDPNKDLFRFNATYELHVHA